MAYYLSNDANQSVTWPTLDNLFCADAFPKSDSRGLKGAARRGRPRQQAIGHRPRWRRWWLPKRRQPVPGEPPSEGRGAFPDLTGGIRLGGAIGGGFGGGGGADGGAGGGGGYSGSGGGRGLGGDGPGDGGGSFDAGTDKILAANLQTGSGEVAIAKVLYRICGHSREGKLSRQECFGACQAVWRPRCCCSAVVRLWLRAADRALASVPATTAILVDRLLQPGCEGELFFVGRSSVISSIQARRMSPGV
jgi:hypothetical protein